MRVHLGVLQKFYILNIKLFVTFFWMYVYTPGLKPGQARSPSSHLSGSAHFIKLISGFDLDSALDHV